MSETMGPSQQMTTGPDKKWYDPDFTPAPSASQGVSRWFTAYEVAKGVHKREEAAMDRRMSLAQHLAAIGMSVPQVYDLIDDTTAENSIGVAVKHNRLTGRKPALRLIKSESINAAEGATHEMAAVA